MGKFKITERGINFLLIFILGFLVGVALKSEAQKRVTIGYNDYLAPQYRQDINTMLNPEPQIQGDDEANIDQEEGESEEQPAPEDAQQE